MLNQRADELSCGREHATGGGETRKEASRNLQKYNSSNPLQRWLLRRFQTRLVQLVQHSKDRRPQLAAPAGPGFSLLDAGCGEGFSLEFLSRQMVDISLFGIDLDQSALRWAAERNHGVPLQQADAQYLPWKNGSFNLVICLEVLEHVADPEKVLAEIKRVSAGDILVSVPHQPYFALANFLRGKNWRTLGEDPEHIHHWRRAEFLGWLKERLDVVEVVDSFPWILVLGRAA